jgi:hypothetical protein
MPNIFSSSLSCRNWSPNYSVLVLHNFWVLDTENYIEYSCDSEKHMQTAHPKRKCNRPLNLTTLIHFSNHLAAVQQRMAETHPTTRDSNLHGWSLFCVLQRWSDWQEAPMATRAPRQQEVASSGKPSFIWITMHDGNKNRVIHKFVGCM